MSANSFWVLSLCIALVAALATAGLLTVLVMTVRGIDSTLDALLDVAVATAGNTAHIPDLNATGPVVGLIAEELHVQDDYMNALTDGFGALVETSVGSQS